MKKTTNFTVNQLSYMEYYFKTATEWRQWLEENHSNKDGIYLIFYKVENKEASMRWEEAVKVALCYGWIDSTVKSLGNGKRKQYFCPRKPKSVWSALNKKYIDETPKSEPHTHERPEIHRNCQAKWKLVCSGQC